ncbi:MAG: diguanylate cyclase [Proteobacteria bacterium]|nr:diguanylate cyclase [Pseudomonadota bacterium]
MTHDASLLTQAYDAMPCAVMITDAQGIIVSVNRAFSRVTGWAADEVIGQTPRMLASGRQDADFFEAMWSALLTQGCWQGELWNRRKSGEVYPEFLSVEALRKTDGGITHFVAVFSDLTERKEREQRLSYLAYHDELTGLANRTLFLDRLDSAVSIARRKGGLVAVQAINLDGFKAINETFGLEAGDLLLKAAAKRVKECLRESDTVARLEGDGFGVILPVLDGAKGAREAAQRILAALCRPVFLAGDEISLGASIGIALFPADGVSAAELAKNAELTMAEVKKRGKRAFAFYEDAAPGASKRRQAG